MSDHHIPCLVTGIHSGEEHSVLESRQNGFQGFNVGEQAYELVTKSYFGKRYFYSSVGRQETRGYTSKSLHP